MREIIDLISEGQRGLPLPATPENIAAAKAFALKKWRERSAERGGGRAEPYDLSKACKFGSWFAAKLFGGTVKGHYYHQWCLLPNGQRVDLADDASDVAEMLQGKIPEYAKVKFGEQPRLPPIFIYRMRDLCGQARPERAILQFKLE